MAARNLSDFEQDGDECLTDYKYVFHPDVLKNKVAFVTGGGSGIGFRITELLMRHGCDTAIGSRKLERVQEAAQKLRQSTGRECLALKVDVRDSSMLHKAFDEILSHYGKLDILVNNAAGNFLCPAENLSYNAFKTVMDIDTMGTYNTTKAAFDKWFKRNGGCVIDISAVLQYRGNVLQTHAGCAKAAIDAMIKHLAVEWGPKGVRINGIAPGPITGTEGMRRLGGRAAQGKRVSEEIPLQRMGYKTEIAESAIFLASDAASYVTGTVMVVDGGSWMTSGNSVNLAEVMRSRM